MSTHSDEPVYDPASWAANRSDAGWALLSTVWSSMFAAGAVVAAADNEDVAVTLMVISGILGFVTLIALTLIGCRLAFGKVVWPSAPAPMRSAPPPDGDGAPSVRIVTEPTRQRSDAQVMVVLGVGIVLTIVVVGLIVVALRG